MRWYAKELGHAEEEEFWGITGLLHDIDFELYPEEHCKKAPELLMEKVLFAAGCSRDVISQGAEMLGWELDDLFDKTIQAMRSCEASVAEFLGRNDS